MARWARYPSAVFSMDAPRTDTKASEGGCCGREAPVLVAVNLYAADAPAVLKRCVAESGCRLFAAVDGAPEAFVIEGVPESLHRLRNVLTPVPALRLVRESIEWALGDAAAPQGLPRLHEGLYKQTAVAEEMPVETGTTLLVSKEFTFDAAHNLPRYVGKCERLHGHTFKLRVTVKAPLDTWSGMAFDFAALKRSVDDRIVKILDHSYVNEIVPNPSAEFIAIWVWRRLSDLPMHEVQVWETPTSFVTYQGPP
jgi:6-pyruvoyltetrahydropterin/6-carboxytetrahydropterin synthase